MINRLEFKEVTNKYGQTYHKAAVQQPLIPVANIICSGEYKIIFDEETELYNCYAECKHHLHDIYAKMLLIANDVTIEKAIDKCNKHWIDHVQYVINWFQELIDDYNKYKPSFESEWYGSSDSSENLNSIIKNNLDDKTEAI